MQSIAAEKPQAQQLTMVIADEQHGQQQQQQQQHRVGDAMGLPPISEHHTGRRRRLGERRRRPTRQPAADGRSEAAEPIGRVAAGHDGRAQEPGPGLVAAVGG